MKLFLFILIFFVAADAGLLTAGLGQRAEEDEIEFSDAAVETSYGISLQMAKRPWTLAVQVPAGVLWHPLKVNARQHEPRSYSRVPAEVAVNSDA